MIKGFAIIFVLLFIGDAISNLLNIPIPGNVIGMVLMTIVLKYKIISLKDVKPVSDVLVKNLAFLFIPPGVGVMVYFNLIKSEFVPIITAWLFSTLLVLTFVGKIQDRLSRRA